MPCVPPHGWEAADALYCVLRQHHLQGYGQWGAGMLLQRPGVRRGIEAVLRREAAAAAGERRAGASSGVAPDWTPEDAVLDVSWVPHGAPAPLRRFLSVPRCTNTFSLYLYLLLQLVLQLYIHLWIRRVLTRRRTTTDAAGGVTVEERFLLPTPAIIAVVVAVSVCVSRLTFLGLQRTLLPYVHMPNLFFNVAFTVCLAILMSHTERHTLLSLSPGG